MSCLHTSFLILLLLQSALGRTTPRTSILVIGGSGRVGGSAVRSLLNREAYDVSIAGRQRSNLQSNFKADVKFQELDIYDEEQLDSVIPNFDVIVHTAGPSRG